MQCKGSGFAHILWGFPQAIAKYTDIAIHVHIHMKKPILLYRYTIYKII